MAIMMFAIIFLYSIWLTHHHGHLKVKETVHSVVALKQIRLGASKWRAIIYKSICFGLISLVQDHYSDRSTNRS